MAVESLARDDSGPPAPPNGPVVWRLAAAAAATLYLVLALHAAWVETPTVDEFAHLPAGAAHLERGDFQIYNKNPPLLKMAMALAAGAAADVKVPEPPAEGGGFAPWVYGKEFAAANQPAYFRIFFAARAVVALLGLVAGVIVFLWARALAGERAAGLAAALFFLCPNLLAHGHVATVDVGAASALLLALYLLRRHLLRPAWTRALLAGAALGAALLIKFTALLFAPVMALVCLWLRRRAIGRALGEVAAMAAVALLLVNAGMGFQGSGEPLGRYAFQSDFMKSAARLLPATLPVPLPRQYLLGFDAQKKDTEEGEFGSYLNGRWSREGWPHYFLVALAVKTPETTLLLWLLAPPFFLFRRRRAAAADAWLLYAPIVLLLFVMSFLNRLNVGVRYLLPALPLLFISTAPLLARLRGRLGGVAVLVLVLYPLATAAAVHPSYLGYFNPASGGPDRGHRRLIASNLDWGQDLYRLKPALEELGRPGPVRLLYFGHVPPAFYGIQYALVPDQPIRGLVAASVNYLKGWSYLVTAPDGSLVRTRPNHLAWLAGHEPIRKLGSIWLFDLRPRQDR